MGAIGFPNTVDVLCFYCVKKQLAVFSCVFLQILPHAYTLAMLCVSKIWGTSVFSWEEHCVPETFLSVFHVMSHII